MVPAPASRR